MRLRHACHAVLRAAGIVLRLLPPVLLAATALLWLRSYFLMDRWHFTTHREAATHSTILACSAISCRGDLEIEIECGQTLDGLASDVAESARTRFYTHDSIPGGRLHFQAISPASLGERLGFRFASAPWEFVRGFMALWARTTIINLPLWSLHLLLTGIILAQTLFWIRKRRRAAGGRFPITPTGA